MIPKYRAFEKDRKIMCKVEELIFGESGDLQKISYFWEEYGEYLLSSDLDDVILMQSTGLLDKNGTEIFEGDILKITNTVRFLEGENITCYGRVEIFGCHVYTWVDPMIDGKKRKYGMKMLFGGIAKYIGMRGVATNDVEVIGNIHENPELIENET